MSAMLLEKNGKSGGWTHHMQLMTTCGDSGKGRVQMNNQYIKEAKAKHKELDAGRTHQVGRRDVIDAMDKILPVSTRIWD